MTTLPFDRVVKHSSDSTEYVQKDTIAVDMGERI